MFSLVKLDNDEHWVIESKKLKCIQLCSVEYKGAPYRGYLLVTNDSWIEQENKLEEKCSTDKLANVNYTLPSFNYNNDSDSRVEAIACSTSTRNNSTFIIEDSHLNAINESSIESCAPSTATDILNTVGAIIGDDYLKTNTIEESSIENDLGIVEKSSEHHSFYEVPNIKVEDFSIVEEKSLMDIAVEISQNNCHRFDGKALNETTQVECHKHNACIQIVNDVTNNNTNDSDNEIANVQSKHSNYFPIINTSTILLNTDTECSNTNNTRNLCSVSGFGNSRTIDNRKMNLISSKNGENKSLPKKHFCKYCKKLYSKIGQHIIQLHKSEDEVKQCLQYNAKHPDRLKILRKIRIEGDYLHNTDSRYNSGILIPCRRPQLKFGRTPDDFICCSSCLGYFAKDTLRLHHINCNTKRKKGERGQVAEGKKLMGYVHRAASEKYRIIVSSFHDDNVSRIIRYDELLTLYGNDLCVKYTFEHQDDMIRNHLRLLGRFLLAIKELDETISDFSSVFHPKYAKKTIEAIRIVAKYDVKKNIVTIPYNATTLGIQLKKCAEVLTEKYIESSNFDTLTQVKHYVKLFTKKFRDFNKKAAQDMFDVRKDNQPQQILPSKRDISILYKYLKNKCEAAMVILRENFQQETWNELSECSLILLIMFNRRRAEEIERLLRVNYNKQQIIQNALISDIYEKVSETSQKQAEQFVRVLVRGKLGRTVPILIHKYLLEYIDTIIKYQKEAGVKSNNNYVFAVPKTCTQKKKYLQACPLIKKFSSACGASIPSTLRGTTLRKHIAIYTAMLGIEDTQVSDVANIMGHADQILNTTYRIPNGLKDMTEVLRLLVATMGDDESDAESDIETTTRKKHDKATTKASYNESYNDDIFRDSDSHLPNTNCRSSTCQMQLRSATSQSKPVVENVSDEDDLQISIPKQTSKKRKIPRNSDEDTDTDNEQSYNVKHRNSSPYSAIKRTRWSEEEKSVVLKAFGNLKLLKTMPTIRECEKLITNNEVFHQRNGQALRSWIDNQRRASVRRVTYRRRKLIIVDKKKIKGSHSKYWKAHQKRKN